MLSEFTIEYIRLKKCVQPVTALKCKNYNPLFHIYDVLHERSIIRYVELLPNKQRYFNNRICTCDVISIPPLVIPCWILSTI